MKTENKVITFFATIPMIETAIKVHGEGGMRLMLDIAASDESAFLPTLTFRGKRLVVTLREAE